MKSNKAEGCRAAAAVEAVGFRVAGASGAEDSDKAQRYCSAGASGAVESYNLEGCCAVEAKRVAEAD